MPGWGGGGMGEERTVLSNFNGYEWVLLTDSES